MTSSSPRTLKADAVAVGLLAARVAAAIRRAIAGTELDALDLEEMKRAYESLTGAARIVLSPEEVRTVRGPRHLSSIGLAIEAATRRPVEHEPPEDVASALEEVARILNSIIEATSPVEADAALLFFDTLADFARSQAASPGDTVVRPN